MKTFRNRMRSQEININNSFQLFHFHMQVAKVTEILVQRLHRVSNVQVGPGGCSEPKTAKVNAPPLSFQRFAAKQLSQFLVGEE